MELATHWELEKERGIYFVSNSDRNKMNFLIFVYKSVVELIFTWLYGTLFYKFKIILYS